MKLTSNSISAGAWIDPRYAFGAFHETDHVTLSTNTSPHFAWSELPEGTKSLALLCVDLDVPSRPDDVNKEGREIPRHLKRVDFFHWILVDLDPSPGSIEEGAFSSAVTAKGKDGPAGPLGTRQGVNNYREWFSGDADMGGDYFGYDGPCPPWNDSLVHRYQFTLYALDVERCPIEGSFDGPAVREAIAGHVLGEASITGRYTLTPRLRG